MIDLFCGAGGTTTAAEQSNTSIEVVACVNHDQNAIRSHKENHPDCLHFTEDIRSLELSPLKTLVTKLRAKNPGCLIALWASLECTNYSKAKGGMPRDADSRSLADHLFRYIEAISPDCLWLENVREFMSWGPLDKNGRPISRTEGKDYLRWTEKVKSHGYHFDWKLLNSADYGAYTSRIRYFAQFAKEYDLIAFPEPTHEKTPAKESMFNDQKKPWKAVREVLDLEDEGISIFTRKKPLAENTLRRIYAGLIKFVAKGDDTFIKTYNSGFDINRVKSINSAIGSVTTTNTHAKIKTVFLSKYYGTGINKSIDEPCDTLTTKDRMGKVTAQFFTHYYSGGGQLSDLGTSHPTILAVPKSRLTSVNFIDNQYGNSKPQGIEKPVGTVTVNPKQVLVSTNNWILNPNFSNKGNSIDDPCPTVLASRKHYYVMNAQHILNKNSSTAPCRSIEGPCPTITQRTHYLMNPQFNSKGSSIDNPCFTLIARMDKKPPYVVSTNPEITAGILVYETDSDIMIKIKEFMAAYGLADIKMRMLKISELLPIQGFPKGYKLLGTKTEQKKYIGNAVEVTVGTALFQAIDQRINKLNAA